MINSFCKKKQKKKEKKIKKSSMGEFNVEFIAANLTERFTV